MIRYYIKPLSVGSIVSVQPRHVHVLPLLPVDRQSWLQRQPVLTEQPLHFGIQ